MRIIWSIIAGAALLGAAQAAPPSGTYECYSNGTPVPGMNVTLHADGTYTDSDQSGGTYMFDGGSSVVTFSGAGADGQRALYKDGKPPTLTFAKPDGGFDLGIPCDLAG